MVSSTLLKSGTVLIHNADDSITPTLADVLIENDRIVKIDSDIIAPSDCHVVDCSTKLISPGFIDTHHHLWGSHMKGLFEDQDFVNYAAHMLLNSMVLKPEDAYWAQLAGGLELIDAGTTTVLDHSHLSWQPAMSKQAVAATISSGIRAIYAYAPSLGLSQSQEPQMPLVRDWDIPTLTELAGAPALSSPESRVLLGLGFDFWFLGQEVALPFIDQVKQLGVKHFTTHYNARLAPGLPAQLKDWGLLQDHMVFSHAGAATQEDVDVMRETKSYIAVTPSTENSMCCGPPCAFNPKLQHADEICALGTDVHNATTGSMVNEMRLALQFGRGIDSIGQVESKDIKWRIIYKTLEAFNMGTIQGARALNMEKDIGSIAVGKKADLLIVRGESPAMAGAAAIDPVAAVVMHSSIGDVESVMVDGVFRKKDGKLLPVRLTDWKEESKDFVETAREVGWTGVVKELLRVQKEFLKQREGYDLAKLTEITTGIWGFKSRD